MTNSIFGRVYSSPILTGSNVIPDQNLPAAMMVVCIAVLINTALPCRASSESTELEFILSCNPIERAPKAANARVHLSTPGVKTLLVGAIRFYQVFISTQEQKLELPPQRPLHPRFPF